VGWRAIGGATSLVEVTREGRLLGDGMQEREGREKRDDGNPFGWARSLYLSRREYPKAVLLDRSAMVQGSKYRCCVVIHNMDMNTSVLAPCHTPQEP
jgi:hypothetical protein